MKQQLPIIGIDDGGFQLFDPHWRFVDVFGVVMRGSSFTEHIVKTTILKDDPNPTSKIIDMILRSGHLQNIKAVLHKGVTIGGFGVIDPVQFVEQLGIPFIAVLKRKPDLSSIKQALAHLNDGDSRWETIRKHGKPLKIHDGLWIQPTGINFEEARSLIEHTISVGHIPEALRVAHMIGKAIFDEKRRSRIDL